MCAPPGQVLVLVEVLEEGRLTDELLLLAHLLAGASGLCQSDLQGAEGRPHHLSVAKVLTGNTHMENLGLFWCFCFLFAFLELFKANILN